MKKSVVTVFTVVISIHFPKILPYIITQPRAVVILHKASNSFFVYLHKSVQTPFVVFYSFACVIYRIKALFCECNVIIFIKNGGNIK